MKLKNQKKLLFVYNANSGVGNAILDSMHKVFSPSTYDCNLCDITFGVVSENRVWKRFREESPHQMVFLHKDEFTKTYGSKFGHKFTFPIVLVENELELEVLISTENINSFKTAQELIVAIKENTSKI
ncbi:MAG: GTPase [Allomuricauda sp.]